MGRWTPLILMAGGLAILLGTLLGINFPMGGQQSASNTPNGRKSQVLPANINVNSSAGSRTRSNNTATEDRTSVAQDNVNTSNEDRTSATEDNSRTTESRTNVAQNNTPDDSSSSPENTPDSNSTDVQSTDTSPQTNQSNEPIRALW